MLKPLKNTQADTLKREATDIHVLVGLTLYK